MPIPENNQFNLFDKEGKINNNEVLWDRFIRLGERIGDGDLDASERKWILPEYRRLMKQLVPGIKEQETEHRRLRAINIDAQMVKKLAENDCKCGGKLKQARSGSKVAYCEICNARYKAQTVKK